MTIGGQRRSGGPGSGPHGVPAAICLSPILSARYRERDLERIHAAAPGSRLVSVSLEGLADSDLSDVEVLLRGPLPAGVFDRLLARCSRLVWVHSATAGVERVLTPAALERGLVITNARGVFSDPIAEYVLMGILAVCRRLPQQLELQRERTWQPLEGTELRDVTVGVVGLGSIGRRVAELLTAFGARVIATRRSAATADGEAATADGLPSAVAATADGLPSAAALPGVEVLAADRLADLLGRSDFIVLALPLLPETEELFNEQVLAQVKPGAWLVNVARGRLIDERAMLRALRHGPLGGAILDAFVDEPLPADSPLYDLANVIITPHTAWSSGRALDRSIELFCDNLGRFARGEPLLNLVDPVAGY